MPRLCAISVPACGPTTPWGLITISWARFAIWRPLFHQGLPPGAAYTVLWGQSLLGSHFKIVKWWPSSLKKQTARRPWMRDGSGRPGAHQIPPDIWDPPLRWLGSWDMAHSSTHFFTGDQNGTCCSYQDAEVRGFLDGSVVKNPPANAGDTGSIPGPGRSHMPRSN